MTTKTYYIENTPALDDALTTIAQKVPCFFSLSPVEMNFYEVEIEARNEDISTIERILAPLV